jgi:hypothetical protein
MSLSLPALSLSLCSLSLSLSLLSPSLSTLSLSLSLSGDEARTLAFCDTVRKVGRGAVNERLLVLSATHMQLLRFARVSACAPVNADQSSHAIIVTNQWRNNLVLHAFVSKIYQTQNSGRVTERFFSMFFPFKIVTLATQRPSNCTSHHLSFSLSLCLSLSHLCAHRLLASIQRRRGAARVAFDRDRRH